LVVMDGLQSLQGCLARGVSGGKNGTARKVRLSCVSAVRKKQKAAATLCGTLGWRNIGPSVTVDASAFWLDIDAPAGRVVRCRPGRHLTCELVGPLQLYKCTRAGLYSAAPCVFWKLASAGAGALCCCLDHPDKGCR
jgi:hypothetical protein